MPQQAAGGVDVVDAHFATLALAIPINESGPVCSAMTPTLMGDCFMAFSSYSPRLDGPDHDRRMPASRYPHMGWIPYVCWTSPCSSAKSAAPARVVDADLRIEALDVIVGGLWRDIELAGGFLGRVDRPRSAARPRFRAASNLSSRAPVVPARGLAGAVSTASTASGQSFPSLTAARSFAAAAASLDRRPIRPRFARRLKCFCGRKNAGSGRKIGTALRCGDNRCRPAARDGAGSARQQLCRRHPTTRALARRDRDEGCAASVSRSVSGPARIQVETGTAKFPDVVRVGRATDIAHVGRGKSHLSWPPRRPSDATARE